MSGSGQATSTEPKVQWPQVTGQAAADLIGFSAPWLRKLELQGYVERKENKLFDLGQVLLGYIAFLKDADRRTAKDEGGECKLAAEVEKLRLTNAKVIDALIETELVEECAKQQLTALRAVFLNMEPLHDSAIEAAFKERIAHGIKQTENAFADFFADVRARRPVLLDDDD